MRTRMLFSLVVPAVLASGGFAAPVAPVMFGTPVTLDEPGAPTRTAVADVTGDGKLDLVTTHESAGLLTIRPGNGDGTFGQAYQVAAAPDGATAYSAGFVAARLDGDAVDDLLVTRRSVAAAPFWTTTIDVTEFLADGAGGFTQTPFSSVTLSVLDAQYGVTTLADWDGDGDLDALMVGAVGYLGVRANDGTGAFGAQETIQSTAAQSWNRPTGAIVRDFDGDGLVDLAVADRTFIGLCWRQADGSVGSRDATFAVAAGLDAADLDGDGRTDLVGFDADRNLVALLQTAPRSFAPARRSSDADQVGSGPITLADLNGDGRPEIVTTTAVLVNQGDGTFGPPIALASADHHARSVAVADLDGDAVPELVLTGTFDAGRDAAHAYDALQIVPVRSCAGGPTIASLSPGHLFRDATIDVDVAGVGFKPGLIVDFGVGVATNRVVSVTPTLARVNVTVAPDAVTGPRSFVLRNPDGGCAMNAVTLYEHDAAVVLAVRPGRLDPGDVIEVDVHGANFFDGLVCYCSSTQAVWVAEVDVIGPDLLRATMRVDPAAKPGACDLTITNRPLVRSVAPAAFVVRTPASIDLSAVGGVLRPARGRRPGSMSAHGRWRFNQEATDTAFDPATDAVEVRVGDPKDPLVVEIPAGAAWTVKRSRAEWRSPRGANPAVRVIVDSGRGAFRIDVARAQVAPSSAGAVLVEFSLAGERGSSSRLWRRGSGGVMSTR